MRPLWEIFYLLGIYYKYTYELILNVEIFLFFNKSIFLSIWEEFALLRGIHTADSRCELYRTALRLLYKFTLSPFSLSKL